MLGAGKPACAHCHLLHCTTPCPPRRTAGCLLSPSPDAAVVGGNVLTSQRVTDVVLRAFGAAAASQVGRVGWGAWGGCE